MLEEHIAVALDATLKVFRPSCHWIVSFNRNASDSFAITISRGGSGFDGPELQKRDVLPLLPMGSQWEAALGWRSFFGMPFWWAETLRLAIGVEGVVAHGSRGAYPISRFAVFDLDRAPVNELAELASLIASAPMGASSEAEATHGVIPSLSSSPRDHVDVEARILRRASASYRKRRRLLFRSLLLSEDQIPASKTMRDRISSRIEGRRTTFDQSLLATVPSIRATFSFRARSQMKLKRRLC